MNNTQTHNIMENTSVILNVSGAHGQFEFCFETEQDAKLYIADRIQAAKKQPDFLKTYPYRNRRIIMFENHSTRYVITSVCG